jgi:hypothetical protein
MELLHIYNDGSKLYKMSALSLIFIPIWKGNRIIDMNHVNNIKDSINNNVSLLDYGYKIIKYNEIDENNNPIKKSYIIDGQHRISVLQDYFTKYNNASDFLLTVTEINVESEIEAIEYFNKINNVKPIQYEEDTHLIVNKYLKELIKAFPCDKSQPLFRNSSTRRPYLSLDKLREVLHKKVNNLKNMQVSVFVEKCVHVNKTIIQELEISSLNVNNKDIKLINNIIKLNFALAWDIQFRWLDDKVFS